MNILDLWHESITALRQSDFVRGAVTLLILLVIVFTLLSLLFILTHILRKFVHRDPIINRTHRTLIYLLTMGGAAILIFGGLLGVVLPIIPGIVLLVMGLLLLRKYHRWQWMELRLARLKERIRIEKEMYRIRRERKRRERENGAREMPSTLSSRDRPPQEKALKETSPVLMKKGMRR